MGNIPSTQAEPIPVPVKPVYSKKKDYRTFNKWNGTDTERIINDYLLL